MAVVIPDNEIKRIRAHGEETYPEECCGVLIGELNNHNIITETRKAINTNAGSKNTRYNIDPRYFVQLDNELEEKGLEIKGIYHSHPDHPSKPSQFDLDHAWPNFSYIVLSVVNGKAYVLTSWRLIITRENFEQESIEIVN